MGDVCKRGDGEPEVATGWTGIAEAPVVQERIPIQPISRLTHLQELKLQHSDLWREISGRQRAIAVMQREVDQMLVNEQRLAAKISELEGRESH